MIKNERATVMLVDDDRRLAEAIARSFRLYGYCADVYPSAAAAIAGTRAGEAEPAAALVDLHLDGGSSGIELAHLLRDRWPRMPLCIFSGHRLSHLRALCDREKIDVIEKSTFTPCRFLRWVALSTMLRAVPRHLRPVSELCERYDLAPQEAKIVAAFAAGVTRSKLATELALKVETVNKQVRRVLRKLGVATSDELCGMLLRVTGDGSAHPECNQLAVPDTFGAINGVQPDLQPN